MPARRAAAALNAFDIAAILAATAALFGYLNHRLLRLPPTAGTLVIALVSSLALILADAVHPAWGVRRELVGFLGEIDFNQTFMHGMLCFLLFAGAMRVDLEGLLEQKWVVALLATVGVLISTAIVGLLSWWVFNAAGTPISLAACLVFGAVIAPTDPVAVMGLLRELDAPKSLESQIAGESLFNDGVGVVVFFALLSMAGFGGAEQAGAVTFDPGPLAAFFVREVGGGALLGLGIGYLGYRGLKSLDDHSLELLITIALVMFTYAASFWIHVSGPIAVVVAGLLIGNPGRAFAMSDRTREHVDAFWNMIDEILNAILFLVIGVEVTTVAVANPSVAVGLLAIPIVLVARLVSTTVPVAGMSIRGRFAPGLIPVLTWSGLRGGISVALVLSLPPFAVRDQLLAATYAVVLFSVIVQGLTVRRVLVYFGFARAAKA